MSTMAWAMPSGPAPEDLGRVLAFPDGGGRLERRRGDPQDPGREGHDLGRDAVADGQLGEPGRTAVGEVGEHVGPVAWRVGAGGLGDVAHHGHRAVQRPPRRHAQLHGRQILHLVDDDVAVGPDLVVVRALAVAPRLAAEQGTGLVEQGGVGIGPRHLADVGRALPVQRGHLVVGQPLRGGEPQAGRGSRRGRGGAGPASAPATSARARPASPRCDGAGHAPRPGRPPGGPRPPARRRPRPRRTAGRRCGGGSAAWPTARSARCRPPSAGGSSGRRGRPGPPSADAPGRGPPWPRPGPCGRRP